MSHAFTVLGAAVAGAVLGHLAFFWILKQGFYAMVVPGGLVGLAASLANNRLTWMAAACGFLALFNGLMAEWTYRPFRDDSTFGYFVLHAFSLPGVTLLMIGVGAFLGFWLPYSRAKSIQPKQIP